MKLLMYLAAMCLSTSTNAGTVIYTHSTYPVADTWDVTVIELDAPEQFLEQFFGQLPADPTQAKQQTLTVIESPTFKQSQQQFTTAYAGVMRAWSLGLKKYPAVVFDDKWVVYGTTDVALAMQQLNAWKEIRQ